MTVGRKRKITSVEEFFDKADEYFKKTPFEEYTVSGLVLALGVCKDTFYEYAKRAEYEEAVKWALLVIENSYETSLRIHGRTGDIFAMKNFGWKDKQEQDITVNEYSLFEKQVEEKAKKYGH